MLKVLVAESEQLEIDEWSSLVKQYFADQVHLSSARTGRDALEWIRAQRPELLIVDSKLPDLGGLDSLFRLNSELPQMVIITLCDAVDEDLTDSPHRADTVQKWGIQEYLRKSFDAVERVAAIRRSLALVRERQKAHRQTLLDRDWRRQAETYLEQCLYFFVLAGTAGSPSAEGVLRLLGLVGARVQVVTLQWRVTDPGRSFAVYENFRESLKVRCACYFGPWREGRFSVLFRVEGDEIDLGLITRDLPLGCAWRGGVGGIYSIGLAGRSLEESVVSLERGRDGDWCLWSPTMLATLDGEFPFGLEKALLRALSAGDPDQAAFLTGPLCSALESLPHDRFESAVHQLSIVAIHHRGIEDGLPVPLAVLAAPFDAGKVELSPSYARDALRELFVKLARRRSNTPELSPVVEKAVQYLRSNFSKAVSLEDTARFAGVHPQYLSRMFSQERGESFVDFLTRLRVSRAKDLLKSGQSVKETAAEVGYADANYFSRLFKKWEGMSPGDYAQGRRAGS